MTQSSSVQRKLRVEEVRSLIHGVPSHLLPLAVSRAIARLDSADRGPLERKGPWTLEELDRGLASLPSNAVDELGAALLRMAADFVEGSED